MSVHIVENWSRIAGEILNIHPSPDLSDFKEVELHVQQVEPVDDYPNLLSDSEDANLVIHFPADLVDRQGLAPGSRISCRVRKAGLARCFVHREHVQRIDKSSESGSSGLF